MSIVQQGPAVEATASVRGIVGIGAQTFGGVKTFANKIIVASQSGGNAIEFGANDIIKWDNPSGSNPTLSGQNFIGAGALRCASGPFVTDNPTGFCIGGINASLSNSGVTASGQSYLADVFQSQSSLALTLMSAKGASSGVVVKVGTLDASPHASAELLRVGYNFGYSSGSDGTAVFKVLGGNRAVIGSAASAPTDADLTAASISFYLDEAGNNLKVRVKYANGTTLKTGTLALV